MKVNTELCYLYRDGCNNKLRETVVLEGRITAEQKREIMRKLDEGRWFIPSQVGLEDLQPRWAKKGYPFPTDDDHVWHELESIRQVPARDNPPTVALTAQELYEAFAAVAVWDVDAAMRRLGMMPEAAG